MTQFSFSTEAEGAYRQRFTAAGPVRQAALSEQESARLPRLPATQAGDWVRRMMSTAVAAPRMEQPTQKAALSSCCRHGSVSAGRRWGPLGGHAVGATSRTAEPLQHRAKVARSSRRCRTLHLPQRQPGCPRAGQPRKRALRPIRGSSRPSPQWYRSRPSLPPTCALPAAVLEHGLSHGRRALQPPLKQRLLPLPGGPQVLRSGSTGQCCRHHARHKRRVGGGAVGRCCGGCGYGKRSVGAPSLRCHCRLCVDEHRAHQSGHISARAAAVAAERG